MKKIFWFVITIVVFLSSCKVKESYEFLSTADSIKEIAIVGLSFDNDGVLVETEIQVIDEIDCFLKSFKNISCYKYYGDPLSVTEEGVNDTVIRITYMNGDYELINWVGQSKYTVKKGLEYYASYNVFDEVQFEALIDKYIKTD